MNVYRHIYRGLYDAISEFVRRMRLITLLFRMSYILDVELIAISYT